MKKTVLRSALFFLTLIGPLCAEHYQIYLLGGQSNGNGRADAAQLTPPLSEEQTDVRLYYLNDQDENSVLPEEQWINLAPGSGHGSKLYYATEFGPEVSFGRAMADAKPTENMAIIKYTYGGSNLSSQWSSTGARYATFVSTVQDALATLTTAGDSFELSGMLWQQGESDTDGSAADNYETNLTNLIAQVRTDLNGGVAFPFVIGSLSDSQYSNITTVGSGPYKVRQAQEAVAAADPTVGIAISDGFGILTDGIHFDDSGQVALGQSHATQMLDLEATSLIHHWKLDGDATDSVGSAGGTEQGGAGYAPGQFGQAVSLDGVDDNILAGTGNITLKDLDDGSTTQVISTTDDITWNFQTLAASPNVIFILSDDQGWYDYGFMQRPSVDKAAVDLNPSIPQNVVKTPAIDRLADEGLAFIHGYSAPVCRPALTSMITGTYLHQHWVTGNDLVDFRGSGNTRIDDTTVEARMQVLNPLPRTLFNELGYTSFQTGKWWEGHHTNGGFTHGDTVNSIATGSEPPQWTGSKPTYVRDRHGDWGLMTGRVDYVNDIQAPAHPIPYANTVKTVTDFIDTQMADDQPFFLWYAPFLPHDPFDPPGDLVDEYTDPPLSLSSTEAKYYANIERFDGGVGAILDHLDTKGIADNTIIIMICDNGRSLDKTTEGKLTPYESGVRSPIIVRWPDRIKPGGAIEPQIVRTPVSMVDMVPTVHHALGLPTFPEMRGIDLLDPAAVASRGVVCGSDHDVEILTLSDPTESLESRFAVRNGWKLILFTSGTKELYHLYDGATPVDPHETTNLAAGNPQLVAELTMEIVNWYAGPNDFNSWVSDPALGIGLAEQGVGSDPGEFSQGIVSGTVTGNTMTFTHHPLNNLPLSDLTASYFWSKDLSNFHADGATFEGTTVSFAQAPSSGGMVTVTATISGTALDKLFVQIDVTQN